MWSATSPRPARPGHRLRHAVADRRNRLQIGVDRFEVGVGPVAVHHDRHRRQHFAAAAHVTPGADRFLEIPQRPLAEAGLAIRGQIGGVADAPGAGPRGVGRRRRHHPWFFDLRRGRQHHVLRMTGQRARHVRLGTFRTHHPRRMAVMAAGCVNDVLAARRFVRRRLHRFRTGDFGGCNRLRPGRRRH
jgi:hypothetical protein